MPLVVICGVPASGKTRVARDLRDRLAAEGHNVVVLNDEALGVDKRTAYSDAAEEKRSRGALQAAVERALNKKDVVIADAGNYIKGFRYQLYCIARALSTPHCVVECIAPVATLHEWNRQREAGYPDAVVDELVARYEAPNAANRWDRPLFGLTPGDALPYDAIKAALFEGKAPTPHLSTRAMPLSDTNYVYELDRTTQQVIQLVQEAQRLQGAVGAVDIPGASVPVELTRPVSAAELQRHRRQFISINRLNTLKNVAGIADVFVQYLNTCLKAEG